MTSFRQMIQREASELNRQQREVHRTFANRDHDMQAWQHACHDFHTYESPMDIWLAKAMQSTSLDDPELRAFVLTFLELDPMFFRSGYVKADMLMRLKRTALSPRELNRVQAIVLDAAERRGQREFKYYGRVAAVVADEQMVRSLRGMLSWENGACRSRARLMLRQIKSQIVKS